MQQLLHAGNNTICQDCSILEPGHGARNCAINALVYGRNEPPNAKWGFTDLIVMIRDQITNDSSCSRLARVVPLASASLVKGGSSMVASSCCNKCIRIMDKKHQVIFKTMLLIIKQQGFYEKACRDASCLLLPLLTLVCARVLFVLPSLAIF